MFLVHIGSALNDFFTSHNKQAFGGEKKILKAPQELGWGETYPNHTFRRGKTNESFLWATRKWIRRAPEAFGMKVT